MSSTDKTIASLYVDQTSDPANPTFYVSRVSAIGTPKQYNDILKMQDQGERERWLHATDKEWRSIYEEQQVLKLVERCEVPTNAIIVPSSFIWKMKDDGTYKARLIAIGSRMPSKEVLEIETQAPAPKLSTVRLLLALAAKFDLPANLADIKTAFLSAKAQNPVYMHLPPGFRDLNLDSKGNPKLALLLKSIYGTANAPFLFYNLLRNFLFTLGFRPSPFDPCLHSMVRNGRRIWVLHWVDDLLMVMDDNNMKHFRIELEKQFETSYKGALEDNLYLGMTVQRWWTPRPGDGFKGFKLTQPHLVEHLLTVAHGHLPSKYNHGNIMMGDVRLSKNFCATTDDERDQLSRLPYRQLLGKAGYFAINTMPQISYPVKELARFATNYGYKHWEALVRLCCYIRDNRDLGLYISGDRSNMVITGYSDADWNGVVDSNLSTTGWIVYLGDVPVSWCSRTQKCTSRSTAESEYI